MAGMSSPLRLRMRMDLYTDLGTDEIRRSGRATKGQNTKERDPDEVPTKKTAKGKGKKGKKAQEEEEQQEDLVRCVCGEYEEETDEPITMLCCDNCEAWQHNDCMGLADDYAPASYFCEQCHPEDHKELLAAMDRGEKPWENIPRKQEGGQASKKKGKKGRKSAAAVAEESPRPATPAAGQKRKAEESPAVPEIKASYIEFNKDFY